jgi:pimeloyl-ACP methyl ester carboxylesterase
MTEREHQQVERANASGQRPVVFIHGLWLLASSWDRWAALFQEHGFAPVAPGWPDDPETVEEANAHPETFANKTVRQVADHLAAIVRSLHERPAIIGHSFGGLFAQILAGRGLSSATVAIDPAPFRGVLPLPISAVRAVLPVLGNPANRPRAIRLTPEQFRYAFTNVVSEDEATELYERYAVPGPGRPLFQAATANVNPWTEVTVDTRHPARGPLLVVSGEWDNTVPRSMAHAAFRLQKKSPHPTEFIEMKGRGHSLTIDSGWREVAETALAFVERFVRA